VPESSLISNKPVAIPLSRAGWLKTTTLLEMGHPAGKVRLRRKPSAISDEPSALGLRANQPN